MKLILPAVFSVDEMRAANRTRHIVEPARLVEGTIARFARDRIDGFLFTAAADGVETFLIPKSKNLPASISRSVVGDVDPNVRFSKRHINLFFGQFTEALGGS